MRVFRFYSQVIFFAAIMVFTPRIVAAHEISQVRGLPEHALAALPDAVEVALLFDKAAQLRATEGGQKLFKFVSSTGLLKQLEEAWPALASDLELPPDQAFDELLGRRAIIAATGVLSDHASQWVLITHVTAEVEKSLRSRLRPAARGLIHGFPILAIGGGRYELATSEISGAEGNAEKLSTVVLAPGGGMLLDEVLKSLASRGPLEDSPALPVPRLKSRVDGMLLVKNPRTSRRTMIAATVGMQSWDLEFASDNPENPVFSTLPAAVSKLMLAGTESTCFAAASARGSAESLFGFAMLDQILWSLIPLDKSSREPFAHGAAISVSPGHAVSWALPVEESASAAAVADRSMSMLFASINRAGPGFHGEFPGASRNVRTSLSIVNPLSRIMDPAVTLRWSIQPAADGRMWWFAACESSPPPDLEAKSSPECVFFLSVRPEPAFSAFGSLKLLDSAPLSALRQIRSIQMSVFADPGRGPGWCAGSGRIELVP